MPLDVLISYIYLDSLLRSPLASTLEQRLESWTTLNDTLTYAAKCMCTLIDYNPIIFNQYTNEVGLQTGSDSGLIITIKDKTYESHYIAPKYYTSLDNLRYYLVGKMYRLLSTSSDTSISRMARSYFAILNSEYILRVQVVSIDSTMNKLSSTGYHRYNVTARVIDTIYGKTIPSSPTILQNSQHSIEKILSNNSSHYTSFEYAPNNYYVGLVSHRDISADWIEDSSFKVSQSDHRFKLRPGQEAIMFLKFHNPIFDNQYDYFNIDVSRESSYNALPIIDGNIRDINHIWSDQTTISYSQWLAIVQNLIAKIKSRNY